MENKIFDWVSRYLVGKQIHDVDIAQLWSVDSVTYFRVTVFERIPDDTLVFGARLEIGDLSWFLSYENGNITDLTIRSKPKDKPIF
jgi:hypothetical protein